MKKSKLISLLQELDGDPDIILWNGLVCDWVDISPTLIEGNLIKETFDHYCQMIQFERQRDNNNWDYQLTQSEIDKLRNDYKKYINWEDNEFVCIDDIKQKRYKSKRVVYIDAKIKGKSNYDRLGKINY
jgi:hypothetical protein